MQGLVKSLLQTDKYDKGLVEDKDTLNVNLVYDFEEDNYIWITATNDNNVSIVTGRMKDRRYISKTAAHADHPYAVAQQSNALGLK